VRPRFELAQVIREYGERFVESRNIPSHHLRTLRALQICRTADLGGHVEGCDHCGHIRVSYNSCRNRHCPKCQGTNRERWILRREEELPRTGCFHLVFTLPSVLNELCLHDPRAIYNILFGSVWDTIRGLSRNPRFLGAETGMIAILHTWGQQLMLHPHLHCIVPAGGLTLKGRWKPARNRGKYLFPVKAMGSIFRAKFMANLTNCSGKGNLQISARMRKALFEKPWVVYAKEPIMGSRQIIEYLGRYTHKIAISNHRIMAISGGRVTFRYKDYRDSEKEKQMTLDATEFLRRFCLHILPSGFRRIRHYGILSNRNKKMLIGLNNVNNQNKAVTTSKELSWKDICVQRLGFDPDMCHSCKKGRMITLLTLLPGRAPPDQGELSKRIHLIKSAPAQ